jgi:hypothetical protein
MQNLEQKGNLLSVVSPFALLVIISAAVKLIIHILTASNYGYFCDELYAIAMSKHLAFGYVDLPPLAPALIALSRLIFGESLFAIHIFPALAGSATLVFVCLITRELGGKLFATGLSALAFIITPFWLIMNSFFGYDSIDQLVLAIFLFALVRLIRTENRKLWIALGLIGGIACLTKTTILFLGPGFIVALLFSKLRKHLLSPWPWLALGTFLAVLSPYLLWEYFNKWPTLEYWVNYHNSLLYRASVPQYLLNIFMTMNPILFPLLLIGLYRIFRPIGDRNYGFFGIMFLTTLVFLFSLKAKCFMLIELFVPIIAVGSVFVEDRLSGSGWKKTMRIAALSCLLAAGVIVAPSALPMLPPNLLTSYAKVFGFLYKSVKNDSHPKTDFPQEFANRFGWDNLVRTVAGVYDGLPQGEKEKCGIWADWFGPAGAIDLFGPRYGLPHAVSGNLTYYLWGPGKSWDVMIFVTSAPTVFIPYFQDVQYATTVVSEYTMPYNTNLPVYVMRKPRMSADKIWPRLKYYN